MGTRSIMKTYISILSALLTTAATAKNWSQTGIFIEKNFDWTHFDQEVENAVNAGYDTIYVGFYMARYGCTAACTAWRDLQASVKQNSLDFIAQNNASLVLSVCGPGEFLEGDIRDGLIPGFASSAGQFAKDQGFTGINYSCNLSGSKTEPSVFATNGSYVDLMSTMISGGKAAGYNTQQISITAQAPYFSPTFVNASMPEYSLSYFALNSNSEQDFSVGRIILNMLNEDKNYVTYNDIFITNQVSDDQTGQPWAPGSAVKQISALGVDSSKITVLKSVTSSESSVKSGYVDPATLGGWGCQANQEFGWTGGYLGWTWNSFD